jgi:hypothetical protein
MGPGSFSLQMRDGTKGLEPDLAKATLDAPGRWPTKLATIK